MFCSLGTSEEVNCTPAYVCLMFPSGAVLCTALHYITLRCIALHYTTRVRKFASSAGTLFHYITLNTSQYNHFVQVLFTPYGYHQMKKQDAGYRRQEAGDRGSYKCISRLDLSPLESHLAIFNSVLTTPRQRGKRGLHYITLNY